MFKNSKKYITEKKLIEILNIRDLAIRENINCLNRHIKELYSKIEKNIQTTENMIRSLEEKNRKDTVEEKYCYKVEYNNRISFWENEKLFKEWFKNEIFKKKAFKANDKAWAIITEILKEDTDEEMD